MVKRQMHGLWPSPITPAAMAQGRRLRDVAWDDASGALLWLEQRGLGGVLLSDAADAHAPKELTPDASVRARVGYGGGDMAASGGAAYYVAGGRLYRQPLVVGAAQPLTPGFGEPASPAVSPDGRWLVYVHTWNDDDCLAIVAADGSTWPQRLVHGADFYMQPTWHPDGRRLAWVEWDHPLMPWDGSRLSMAELRVEQGALPTVTEVRLLAGDDHTAVFQPAFSPDGRQLAYISDVTGWGGLYLYDLERGESRPLWVEEADLGQPAWSQGARTLAWSPSGDEVYICRNDGYQVTLWAVMAATGQARPVAALSEYTHVSQPSVGPTGEVAVIASSARVSPRIVSWNPASQQVRIRARSGSELVPPERLSRPQPLRWPSLDGPMVPGLLYLPVSEAGAAVPPAEGAAKPPLIVRVHGGPTGQVPESYSAEAQFFATRGYAVLEVNYRGSSGCGRAFQRELVGRWGLVDVDDVVSGAKHVAAQGLVDGTKLVVMGGSAGGYTVLQSLIRYPGVFKAGICMYGVTNLFTLATDTHKLEQHYLDTLIGPLPEASALYRERSPLFFADRIQDPVAIFQGEDDQVVPVSQAEAIVAALRQNGIPHEYHLYPGEGHGWRKPETIEAFYRAVEAFLKQYVLFA